MKKQRIAFQTLGCKLNFSESSAILRSFPQEAYETVTFKETADVYVIHSCVVTALAEKKCRTAINQARRRNENAIIAVMGCYSQLRAQEIATMEGVDIVLGNEEKYKLYDYVSHHEQEKQEIHNGEILKIKTFHPSWSINDRTRSFFKIQDGCDHFCTYCTIPFARGRSRSNTIENTLLAAREIAKTQVHEVVLTGVNIGDFGRKNGETFFQLIQGLDEIEGINRYRISSIEPELLTNEIIEFVAQSKHFLPHFHIPLQAGTNNVLQAMKRKYNRELFADRVQHIKQIMPHCFIAADVIVGFPGESVADFEDGMQFLSQLKLSALHVFSYSERPGTKAIDFENKVSAKEKQRRSHALHELSASLQKQFYEDHHNYSDEALFEAEQHEGFIYGYTRNYIRVKTALTTELINTLHQVKLTTIDKDGIFTTTLID